MFGDKFSFMEKNILILATTGGFVYKFELENVKILQRLGYTVHYAGNTYDQHYFFEDSVIKNTDIQVHHIDIARSPYMLKNNRKAFCQLVEIVKKYKIQAIHCHTPMGGVLGRLIGRYFRGDKLRVIYTAHGFHFFKGAPLINNSIYFWVEKLLAPYTDTLIVINEEDYRNARRLRLKKGGKCYKVPGVGLDMEQFSPMEEKDCKERRKKLGIGEKDFFFVSVGELNENKNQEIVLKALLKMKRENKDLSHIKYGICGDGFYFNRIQKEIREWGLEKNVIMYGYCTEVWKILGCADASVFPSRREGLGMAGVESLAMGVPVIAADNRGTREYMIHEKNGYICRWNSAEDFALAIEKMKNLTPEAKQKMKIFSRNSVERFEKSHTREIMEKIYKDLDKQLECGNAYEKAESQKIYEKRRKNHCYYGSL